MSTMFGKNIRTITLICAAFLASCLLLVADDSDQFSPWSAPVNLGSTINSKTGDFFPFISKDGLSLYFTSPTCGSTPFPNCRPGCGGWDIFVSQRNTVNDDWKTPRNLAEMPDGSFECDKINTPYNDSAPSLSVDGHRMYFASDRPGGFGGNDIYVSRRHNKRDDFGWQAPENLGSGVNTNSNEASPAIFEDDDTGVTTLYFDSNRPGGPGPFTDDGNGNGNDIYASVLQPDETFGTASLVPEVSSLFFDRQPAISSDGLEMYLASNRPGTFGGLDLWVSTRVSTSDPWSTPVNLGASINTAAPDAGPALSFDGTTLYFQSVHPDGFGAFDLYKITRTRLQGPEKKGEE